MLTAVVELSHSSQDGAHTREGSGKEQQRRQIESIDVGCLPLSGGQVYHQVTEGIYNIMCKELFLKCLHVLNSFSSLR